MESLESFLDAGEVFVERLGDVSIVPLALAIGLHVLNLLLRTRAWFSILCAAYPGCNDYRWRSCAGAYLSGVGVNSIVPARGGDLVKIYLVRLRLAGSTTATIVSTLLVETLFDSLIAPLMMIYAYQVGVFPSLPDVPSLPAFEFSFAVRHPRLTVALIAVLLFAMTLLLRRAVHAAHSFWARVRQGFSILETPRLYVLRVALPQALGWGCRVASVLFFLQAFGITATLRNAVVVMVVMSVGTLMPFTPGGLGTQQALIVVVLSGEASRSALLGFSVGMQAAMTATNVVVGFTALALMFGSLSFRQAISEARAAQAAAESRAAQP
jgi:uncharacterized membrane protein YbhN (UPF0104 family)